MRKRPTHARLAGRESNSLVERALPEEGEKGERRQMLKGEEGEGAGEKI